MRTNIVQNQTLRHYFHDYYSIVYPLSDHSVPSSYRMLHPLYFSYHPPRNIEYKLKQKKASPISVAFVSFHLVSCYHATLILLLFNTSASSFALPVIVPTFKFPYLSLTFASYTVSALIDTAALVHLFAYPAAPARH